ncbi:MAG: FAD-binding protein, partial [Coriobacteriales bacterium]|nr:FAD-binding protein [Coriobacteriales bacterium]
ERWCNEDLWVGDFAAAGIAQANQKRTYAILTNADIEHLESTGPYVRVFTWGPPGVPLPDVRSELERLSSVSVVDSIEEAARAASLDPEALRETIQRYNSFCESGVDEDFGKDAQYLSRIEAPYWVCETSLGYYTTVGGIKVSSETEVLNEAGEVIGGLYAGGCDAGGLYGDSYDVSLAPGSQASWAINSGRMAAKEAKRYVEEN